MISYEVFHLLHCLVRTHICNAHLLIYVWRVPSESIPISITMGLSIPLSPRLVHLFSRPIQVSEFQWSGSFFHSIYCYICGTEHCVEMIRQQLMCTADVGIITYEWVRYIYYLWFKIWALWRILTTSIFFLEATANRIRISTLSINAGILRRF